jgi:hypothetical protein
MHWQKLTAAFFSLLCGSLCWATGFEFGRQILSEFEGKKILAIGESFHNRPDMTALVYEKIVKLADSADWVGLEIPSDEQADIESYLTFGGPALDSWSKEFLDFLSRIKVLNELRSRVGRGPLRVLALDLPAAGYENEGDWFFKRDPHMLNTLREATNNFSGRGILFMGLGHLSKMPFRLPRIAVEKMGLAQTTELKTLGLLLEEEPSLSGRVVRVVVHSSGSWIERWSQLPPDYKRFYKFMSGQIPNRLIDTDSHDFAKSEAQTNRDFPIQLNGNTDYIVNVPTRRDLIEECQVALSSPGLLVRGLLLRALDLKARVPWR